METSQIHTRIADLQRQLIAYSHYIYYAPELDSTDIQQEMALALLEKANVDPAFASQKPSYLAWYASWQAKNIAAKNQRYHRHIRVNIDDIGDYCLDLCSKNSEEGDPARISERAEQMDELLAQIATLTEENQAVIRMTYLGYSTKEIAAELGISPPAVSQRKRTIRRRIAGQTERNG